MTDMVNRPAHYTSHPSGIECIEITEHMGFSVGNAWKYLHRAGLKHDGNEDLLKALWYMRRERDFPFYGLHEGRGIQRMYTSYEFMSKIERYSRRYAVGQRKLMAYVTSGQRPHLIEAIEELIEHLEDLGVEYDGAA